MNRPHEHGAAMVEMAIVLAIFLALVFAILEFSLLIFNWSRVIESTRAGARYAIVNSVETYGGCNTNVEALSCPGTDSVTCTLDDSGTNSAILTEMRTKVQPGVLTGGSVPPGNVEITYACAEETELTERVNPLLRVTVTVSGIQYPFVVPGLLGMNATLDMPDHSTTLTSEDLYTYSP
ncbi:TadE-like protein [Mariprofundus aestuarium]|uniref:TadE-like protein n=2 Tax=Mariprofundus aestuarium TaxID=1921086 RepID=A0A2K8L123_MARES|nr:TadE-like protein [Mariprofundus aestuarium]